MYEIRLQEFSIFPLPNFGALSSLRGTNAYLDIVPSPGGYNHIAIFNPADSSKPQFLTSGDWEVTGGIRGVDAKRGLVYVSKARRNVLTLNFMSDTSLLRSHR